MKRQPVSSETFISLGYDEKTHCLEAEFQDGDIYRYFEVPASMWHQFQSANSKGRFFAYNIRDHFSYQKI